MHPHGDMRFREAIAVSVMFLPEIAFDCPDGSNQLIECSRCIWGAVSRFEIPQKEKAQLVGPAWLASRLYDYTVALAANVEWFATRAIGGWVNSIFNVNGFKVAFRCRD